MRFLLTALVISLFGIGCAQTPSNSPDVPVIPNPVMVEGGKGVFEFTPKTSFRVGNESLLGVAERFASELRPATGFPLEVSSESGDIQVALNGQLAPESYTLRISPGSIVIEGGDEAGVFYAFQSLRQLLPAQIEAAALAQDVAWSVPALNLEDGPRFPYRGLHLDVGRYFFDVDFVKKYIDTMSRYKYNRFHWHLTEDQGWRIEIKKYPLLTEVGAWRKETILEKNFDPYIGDGIPHGGFYTQDEIREVVQYAAERFVTVIPEIEMPGHSSAVVAAYPQFGCDAKATEVPTTWGVKDQILCPSEETFTFLEDVLTEVMALFPGEYIHIGADEVPKTRWENNALAQEIIRREGLDGEHGLQSWFIRRIEAFLNENGRSLIGWDEILEGGLAPNATVMSWRGMIGGIEAARQGHDVIMTPTKYTYFDFYQADPATEPLAMNWAGFTIPLDTVYSFEPVPDELTELEARHILGAQANVWTEYISTPEYVEYMVYPRALALSEVVWSARDRRDIDSFYRRMVGNLPHLESLGVNYRIPESHDDGESGNLAMVK
jgi:hexosaminidase